MSRRRLFELLSALLLAASLLFFYRCLGALADRDYVAAILVMFIGFAVLRVGGDLARLALLDGPGPGGGPP
jgi:hypothetical protein